MKSSFTILALAATAFAKTDLAGCTSSAVGASLLWYVPGTGEICSILDCGGGRAPAKTNVPGCAAYAGTASYTPSFIPGYGQASATAVSSVAASTTATAGASPSTYNAMTSVPAASTKVATVPASEVKATTLTTPPVPSASTLAIVGTGIGGNATSVVGGNNVTAPAGTPTKAPLQASANAAVVKGVAQGVAGIAMGVFGVMML